MNYSALLKNNAARKAQMIQEANRADRFDNFVKELQALCDKYDFKDHDDFLAQVAEFQGVSIDDLTAKKAKAPAGQPVDTSTGAVVADGTIPEVTKRFFLNEDMTAKAKKMAEEDKMSDKEIAEHFKCKEDLIKRRREGGFVYKAPGKPKAPK
jgi:hypothetical protein